MQNHFGGHTEVWNLKSVKVMKNIAEELEKDNLVEPIPSKCAAPSSLVKKKNRTHRLVVDYRRLKSQIETGWPLPIICDVIDSLDVNKFFSNSICYTKLMEILVR